MPQGVGERVKFLGTKVGIGVVIGCLFSAIYPNLTLDIGFCRMVANGGHAKTPRRKGYEEEGELRDYADV
jgi:hypothetical protein